MCGARRARASRRVDTYRTLAEPTVHNLDSIFTEEKHTTRHGQVSSGECFTLAHAQRSQSVSPQAGRSAAEEALS